jgi:hypothetical protein
MTQPRSNTLFHFTKSLNILKDIISNGNGFFPRYCLEDITWSNKNDKDTKVAHPMVCFCDIPLSRINEHVEFYGYYGLGMSKKWGINQGLNPVTYVTEKSPVRESLKHSFELPIVEKGKGNDKFLIYARRIIAFSKPISGRITVNETPKTKDFYQESEWRYLATNNDIKPYLRIDEHCVKEKLDHENASAAEKAPLKFSLSDVRYIFVNSENDILELVDFIDRELDCYPARETKILKTRILSLSEIQNDL